MSGKPKGPADPAAEREELRQLTRELHEAAQDARAAARELQAARTGLGDAVDATVDAALQERYSEVIRALTEHFKLSLEAINNRVDFHVDHVAECAKICIDKISELASKTEARLLGYDDVDAVQQAIQESIIGAVRDLAGEEAFVRDVAAAVQPKLKFVVT